MKNKQINLNITTECNHPLSFRYWGKTECKCLKCGKVFN